MNTTTTLDLDKVMIMTDWRIITILCNDQATKMHFLFGFTMITQGTKVVYRLRKTSPVISCKNGVAVTASGSRYILLEPNKTWAEENGLEVNRKNPIPPRFINSWIEPGSTDWLTR